MLSDLTGRWPQVSAQSVLDILLVAVLIYEFLKLIKGTRAMPVLFGVASLALASYLAWRLELRTVIWVMSNLLPYAIFALIVVFQSEIRYALAKLGRKFTFSRVSGAVAESYDDIVLAANLFSHLRALDASGARRIAVMKIPHDGLGEAVNDRLKRAAAPRQG